MSFDNTTGKEAPEYEAFEAALQIAEQQTKSVMLRVVEAIGRDEKKEDQSDDKSAASSTNP